MNTIGDEYSENWFDDYQGPGHMSGQATTLHSPAEDDPVAKLRQIVEEVTGKPVEAPARQRMGFL